MFKVEIDSYKEMLLVHYNTKIPLYIYGPPGIGKSQIPIQIFSAISTTKNKTFIQWADTTFEQKLEAIRNPDKYFVYVDVRMAQADVGDLRGLPKFANNNEFLEYSPTSWAVYFSKKGADGVLFFDELNQAAPIIQSQCFQVILDRTISDMRLSDDVFIMAAGNRASDKASVFNMSFPLKDRFSEIELTVDDEAWREYAVTCGINPHLIAFIAWKPSCLYRPPSGTEDKGSTPRGVFRASKLIEKYDDIRHPMIRTLVSSAVGEAFSYEFGGYVSAVGKIDLEMLLANPKRVKELTTPDMRYAICGLLGEHVRKTADTDVKRMAAMYSIVHNMEIDFAVIALNMIRSGFGGDNAKFKKTLIQYPDHKELFKIAAKYAV